jgi:Leucine-rich repeat (LRR) protein/GTPase SAR1 family protein
LGQLDNLTKLYLWENKLSEVPAFIEKLRKLEILHLNDNQLSIVPEFIGQLNDLSELSLAKNQLSTLPNSLGQLDNLTKLYLWKNKLSEVPAFIEKLRKLEILALDYNQLTTVPEFIGHLNDLSELGLGKNQLRTLPSSIGKLRNLSELYLWKNDFCRLPEAISRLHNLSTLNVNDNRLTYFPEEVENLHNLATLKLARNNIIYIPDSVMNLHKLKILNVEDNHIDSPPQIVINKGPSAIRNYFKQLHDQGIEYLHEARVLIVGEGGAGKTTLQAKLLNPDYILPEGGVDETIGIQIESDWHFPYHANPEIVFRAHLWDFGGQEIQYMTHQFFLRDRSLYILVADDRREDSDFDYWFKAMNTFGKGSPVLVVLNERNSKSASNFDSKYYQKLYPELQIDVFCVDLAGEKERVLKLTQKVQELTSSLPHIGESLPSRWIPIRNELADRRKEHHLSFAEFSAVCARHGIDNEDDVLGVSRYLDALGLIVHFRDDCHLNDFVIIDPQWVAKAMYTVLKDKTVQRNQGIMDQNWIFEQWKQDGHRLDECGKLLNLMKRDKFEICYEIKESDPPAFMVPQLLPSSSPVYSWENSENLQFRFSYPFMPKGIIARLIVRLNQYIAVEDDKTLIWHRGVVLVDGNVRAEVTQMQDAVSGRESINIRVQGLEREKKDMLSLVRRELHHIHQHSFPNIQVYELIPCCGSACSIAESPQFFIYTEIEKIVNNRRSIIYCSTCNEDIAIRTLLEGVVDHREDGEPNGIEERNHGMIGFTENKKSGTRVPKDSSDSIIQLLQRGSLVIENHNHLTQNQHNEQTQQVTQKSQITVEVKNEIMMDFGGQLENLKEDILDELDDEQVKAKLKKEFAKVEKAVEDIEQLASPEEAKGKKGAMSRIKGFLNKMQDTSSTVGKAVQATEGALHIAKELAKLYNKIAPWAGCPLIPAAFLKKKEGDR